jgi:hypothetical protein
MLAHGSIFRVLLEQESHDGHGHDHQDNKVHAVATTAADVSKAGLGIVNGLAYFREDHRAANVNAGEV